MIESGLTAVITNAVSKSTKTSHTASFGFSLLLTGTWNEELDREEGLLVELDEPYTSTRFINLQSSYEDSTISSAFLSLAELIYLTDMVCPSHNTLALL